MGTRWWAFGSLDAELKRLKMKQRRRLGMGTSGVEAEQEDKTYGEKPGELSLVLEGGVAEIDVVSAHLNK